MRGFVEEGTAIVPERSVAACAVAATADRAYLGWTGSDYRLNVAWSPDGLQFGDTRTYRHRSARRVTTSDWTPGDNRTMSSSTTRTIAMAPALAATAAGLHVAWTGTDDRVNLWPLAAGDAGHMALGQRSIAAPSLGVWGAGVIVAWAGRDARLNLLYPDRTHVVLDETSRAAPAVCGVGPDVVVVWTGTDRHVNVLRSQGGRFGTPYRTDETSNEAPAACPVGDGVAVAWMGTDRRVNALTMGPGGMSAPIRFDARTSWAPALCRFGPGVLLAWTGSDLRPNLARLRLAR